MSKDRIMSSVVMILVIILAMLNDWLFLIVLSAFTIGGLYEFFYLIKKKGIPIYSYTGIMVGVLIPISTFFQFQPTKGWELLFIVILLLTIFMMQLMRRENSNAIVGISTTLFGILYVAWLLSFVVRIRFLMPGVDGLKLLGFVLIVTKAGDVGALVFGSAFGKHPLLPRISPNKTIEGSVGSFVFSMGAAFLSSSFIPDIFGFSLWQILIVGFVIGGLGQLGDLSESLIKRDCNVKDSGKMLPAMGGVLDLIDSVLFTVPVYYFFMSSILRAI